MHFVHVGTHICNLHHQFSLYLPLNVNVQWTYGAVCPDIVLDRNVVIACPLLAFLPLNMWLLVIIVLNYSIVSVETCSRSDFSNIFCHLIYCRNGYTSNRSFIKSKDVAHNNIVSYFCSTKSQKRKQKSK